MVPDGSAAERGGATRMIQRARVLPGAVLAIRDHFRLRLRPAGAGDPIHEPGTNSRTPRAEPDVATLSVFAYRYLHDGPRGHVAILESTVGPTRIAVADDLELFRRHAELNEAWGYTSLPPICEGSIRWEEGASSIRIDVQAPSLHVRAAIEGLRGPFFIAGNHPRDRRLSFFAAMREADDGWLEIDGVRVPGRTFAHRGYEPWIGRSARSAAIQIGETLVRRPRTPRGANG